jgi:hypothetical protein
MDAHEAIDGETWGILLRARSELIDFFARVARVPRDTAEDCVSEGLIDFIQDYDPIRIATSANAIQVEKHTQIFMEFKVAVNRRLGRERRHLTRHVSDDTPIGDETGDMRLRDLFIPRANTAERVENYAEWMMFSRKGGCPYTPQEINDLFGLCSVA